MIKSRLPSSNDKDVFRDPDAELENYDDCSIVTVEGAETDRISIAAVEGTENHASAESARTIEIPPLVRSCSNECMLYACVIRDETLLAEAGSSISEEVRSTARELLNRDPTVGWDTFCTWRSSIKGLRLHFYQETDKDVPQVWIFACIYDSSLIAKRDAQLFLEKIVGITELLRHEDDSWTQGGDLACQDMFSPILLQRMQEMSYMGEAAVVDDGMDISKRIIQENRKVLNNISQRKAQEEAKKKAEEEALLRQLEDLNRQVLDAMEKKEDCSAEVKLEATETSRLSPKRVGRVLQNLITKQSPEYGGKGRKSVKEHTKGGSKTPERLAESKERVRNTNIDLSVPNEMERDDQVEDILQQLEREASGRRKSWAESFEKELGCTAVPSAATVEKDVRLPKPCVIGYIVDVMRFLAKCSIYFVPVAMAAVAMLRNNWSPSHQLDYLCSPVKPSNNIIQVGVYEAPWWAPDKMKTSLFQVCGERQRMWLEWIEIRSDNFRLLIRAADNNAVANNLLLDERNLKSASIHSRQIILHGKNGKNRTLEAPWTLP